MPIEDNVIARLATSRDADGQPFLSPHHLLAASRLERLIRQAQLGPRLTMSYERVQTGERRRSGPDADDLADCASTALQRLNRLADLLPADCWGVMFDVCGLGKGLQMIEIERRWPRRSAKLVLRIGLTQLADAMGLQPSATGADHTTGRVWRGQRLPIIADP